MEFRFRAGDDRQQQPERRLPAPATDGVSVPKGQIRKEFLQEMLQRGLIDEEVGRRLEIEQALASWKMHPRPSVKQRGLASWRMHPRPSVKQRRVRRGVSGDARRSSVVTTSESVAESVCTDGTKRAWHIKGIAKPVPSAEDGRTFAVFYGSAGLDEHLNGKKQKTPIKISDASIYLQRLTWGCPLCQICTTSEKNLNMHFKGRKHQDKALLAFQKTGVKNPVGTTAMPNEANKHMVENNTGDAVLNAGVSSNQDKNSMTVVQVTPNNMETMGEKKIHIIKCQICDIKCYCESAYDSHLSGKKHKKRLVELNAGVSSNQEKNNMTTVQVTPNNMETMGEKKIHIIKCQICDIECYCESAYDSHLSGKKHKKRLVELNAGVSSNQEKNNMTTVQVTPNNMETIGEKKIHIIKCQICDIKCYCESAYDSHLSGKKHKKRLVELNAGVLSNREKNNMTTVQVTPNNMETIGEKKIHIIKCQICDIECYCESAYDSHLSGKKHKQQLVKLNADVSSNQDKNVMTMLQVTKNNMETMGEKKGKILKCQICNMVCNSTVVYGSHLSGKKHMKQAAELTSRVDKSSARVTALNA